MVAFFFSLYNKRCAGACVCILSFVISCNKQQEDMLLHVLFILLPCGLNYFFKAISAADSSMISSANM